jgi:hypothetical protein
LPVRPTHLLAIVNILEPGIKLPSASYRDDLSMLGAAAQLTERIATIPRILSPCAIGSGTRSGSASSTLDFRKMRREVANRCDAFSGLT